MRAAILGLAAVTMTAPALATPAHAYDRYDRYERYDNGRQQARYSRHYDRNGYYNGPTWRGNDGRRHCRRSDGTTGLIIGGAAGALAGRAIDTRGERATGTILGAVAGALLGRQVERGGSRCR